MKTESELKYGKSPATLASIARKVKSLLAQADRSHRDEIYAAVDAGEWLAVARDKHKAQGQADCGFESWLKGLGWIGRSRAYELIILAAYVDAHPELLNSEKSVSQLCDEAAAWWDKIRPTKKRGPKAGYARRRAPSAAFVKVDDRTMQCQNTRKGNPTDSEKAAVIQAVRNAPTRTPVVGDDAAILVDNGAELVIRIVKSRIDPSRRHDLAEHAQAVVQEINRQWTTAAAVAAK